MSEFLDHYGEDDERRSRLVKRILAGLLIVLIVGGGLYFLLRNRRQKARVQDFVTLLQNNQYKEAYALWGCTDANPCRNYTLEKFMEDWGPNSKHADLKGFEITRAHGCGSGVMVHANFGKAGEEILWVDGPDLIIGFAPWPVCPER